MGLLGIFKKNSDKKNDTALPAVTAKSTDLVQNSEAMLEEVSVDLTKVDAVELPVAQLSTLGGGIAAMLPALRSISEKVSGASNGTYQGLYRCYFPEGVAGQLATAHSDGRNIGAIMNGDRITGQARWVKAGPDMAGVSAINPATLMMAAALIAIEKKLDEVLALEQQIISFLQEDKESKIEGDLKTLTSIIKEYKFAWDNSTYTATHHQLAADIKRDAEANMIFYQKQVTDALKANPAIFLQQLVNNTQADLQKKFKYYRLSLYIYSFSSFLEVMLQGQYSQGYIDQIRQEIIDRTAKYQEIYNECQNRLEKMTSSSVEHNLLKGLGGAGKAFGGLIGNIPIVKDGPVDNWLIENGAILEQNGENFGKEELAKFKTLADSGSDLFIDHLEHVNRLFNQTQEIYIGKDSVYLVKA